MNKEFLDPNTRYSDQKVDLAKMPGLVSELDARITALEEGGGGGGTTLYGPFTAYNSSPVTTSAGPTCVIDLDEIYDVENNVVTFPQTTPPDYKFLLQQFGVSIPANTSQHPADDYKLNRVRPTAISIEPGVDSQAYTFAAYSAYTTFYSLIPPVSGADSTDEPTEGDHRR